MLNSAGEFPVFSDRRSTMSDLVGKVALVTGATSGIGLETALALAGWWAGSQPSTHTSLKCK